MKKYWAIVSFLLGCGGPNMPQNMVAGLPVRGCDVLGTQAFRQGGFKSFGSPLDVAISGKGFFALRNDAAFVFTRQGIFDIDEDGFLVRDGYRVQGFAEGATSPGDLNIALAVLPPVPTSRIFIRANFDPTALFQAPDSMAFTVYDALGAAHLVQMSWTHLGARRWTFMALVDGESLLNGVPGIFQEIVSGQFEFDEEGRLQTYTQQDNFVPREVRRLQRLSFDFGKSLSQGGSGLEGLTQFASPSSTTIRVEQDGYSFGTLSAIQVRLGGHIEGLFTNGVSHTLGRIAVALFPQPQELRRLPEHLLLSSPASGDAVLGPSGDEGRGDVFGNALEQLPDDSRACEW